MRRLNKQTQIEVLKKAKEINLGSKGWGMCWCIDRAIVAIVKYPTDLSDYYGYDYIKSLIPKFNYSHIIKICKKNNLDYRENSKNSYWFHFNERGFEARLKCYDLLIEELQTEKNFIEKTFNFLLKPILHILD